jgi:hypothetical protein
MEQEKRIRREIANSNERRRMQSINAGFQSLRTLLPHHEGEKLSKVSVEIRTGFPPQAWSRWIRGGSFRSSGSRWLPTSAAPVRSQEWSRWICGGSIHISGSRWLPASVAPVRSQDWSCAIRGGSFPSSGSQTLASCLSGPSSIPGLVMCNSWRFVP